MEINDRQQFDDHFEAVKATLARVELVASRDADTEARRLCKEIYALASDAYGGGNADHKARGLPIAKVTLDKLVNRFRHDLGTVQLD